MTDSVHLRRRKIVDVLKRHAPPVEGALLNPLTQHDQDAAMPDVVHQFLEQPVHGRFRSLDQLHEPELGVAAGFSAEAHRDMIKRIGPHLQKIGLKTISHRGKARWSRRPAIKATSGSARLCAPTNSSCTCSTPARIATISGMPAGAWHQVVTTEDDGLREVVIAASTPTSRALPARSMITLMRGGR